MKNVLIVVALVGCSNSTAPTPEEALPRAKPVDPVERGKLLVTTAGCHDCHTPMKMGPQGPEPDFARQLSGHPAQLAMPPAPELPNGPWMTVVSASMTAWSGPWGVSFTANLTPDKETGIGTWNQDTFVATIRNGKHMGAGRPLMPPMPWQAIAQMPDEDLGAIYAYLRSIPAVNNKVPELVPPKTAALPATEKVARQ
jgi:mono/diheme cytochrome c family protein